MGNYSPKMSDDNTMLAVQPRQIWIGGLGSWDMTMRENSNGEKGKNVAFAA